MRITPRIPRVLHVIAKKKFFAEKLTEISIKKNLQSSKQNNSLTDMSADHQNKHIIDQLRKLCGELLVELSSINPYEIRQTFGDSMLPEQIKLARQLGVLVEHDVIKIVGSRMINGQIVKDDPVRLPISQANAMYANLAR